MSSREICAQAYRSARCGSFLTDRAFPLHSCLTLQLHVPFNKTSLLKCIYPPYFYSLLSKKEIQVFKYRQKIHGMAFFPQNAQIGGVSHIFNVKDS